MKKLLVLFTLALVVLVSCNKDDAPLTDSEKIEGTWKFVKYTSDCGTDGIEINILDACEGRSRITFSSSGNYNVISYYDEGFGDGCEADTYQGTWSISESKLYIVEEGESDVFDIDFSGNNKFTLSYTDDGCLESTNLEKVN